jgi:tetratricopeptide (TPR) repeat protein
MKSGSRLSGMQQHAAPWALILVTAMIAIAAYMQALNYLFVSDDTVFITENTKLLNLHSSDLWRLFIEPYNRYSEFLPLRELSYWFDMTLFGLNSAAFRMHNIFLYALSLPFVYLVTLNLWRYFRPAQAASAPWAAAIVTALFALHPALVESVVWISGRKYVLPNLFSMLALWLALIARRPAGLSVPHAAGALLAFAGVMLSKASYVTVAPVIALIWVMFWREIPVSTRRVKQLLWPLAILVLAAILVLIFIGSNKDNVSAYIGLETATRTLAVLGWLVRLAVTPESRHFYYPVLDDPNLSMMVALGAVVFAAAVVSMVMMLRKRPPLEAFSLVVFLLLCLPYLQLVPYAPAFSIVSDRFLTLAAWPVVLLITAFAWRLNRVARVFILLLIALSWGWQTIQRPTDWHSLEALIDADVRAYPGYYIAAQHKIIDVQLKKGLRREALKTANTISDPAARNIMTELIRVDYGVKEIAVATGNPQGAMTLLWKLEQDINPPIEAKWNPALSNFWGRVGFALINEWEFMAKQFPAAAPVHYNAGLWLLKVHKYEEAVIHLRTATESPTFPASARGTALKNLGLALIGSGDMAAAEAPLRAALEQTPPDFRAYCGLEKIYQHADRLDEALHAGTECHRHATAKD